MKKPFHIPAGANADSPSALDLETRLKSCIGKSLHIAPDMIAEDTPLLELGDSLDATTVWMDIEDNFRLPRDHMRTLFMHESDGEKTNILQATVKDMAKCIRKIFKSNYVLKLEQ